MTQKNFAKNQHAAPRMNKENTMLETTTDTPYTSFFTVKRMPLAVWRRARLITRLTFLSLDSAPLVLAPVAGVRVPAIEWLSEYLLLQRLWVRVSFDSIRADFFCKSWVRLAPMSQ